MENKINIAELLKDCPKDMKLDCTVYDDVTFNKLQGNEYIIINRGYNGGEVHLNKFGQIFNSNDSKCVIFPKGKTTWEGFQRPFKDGDILTSILGSIFILKEPNKNKYYYGCYIAFDFMSKIVNNCTEFCNKKDCHFATEEEKQKLFDAIKANGYKWNAKTKTLEKLPKLPKFNVGNRVKHISTHTSGIVVKVDDKGYYIDYHKGEGICFISFTLEKDYELAPNKFDISTLKPFESRVLVRDNDNDIWYPAIFGKYSDKNMTYRIIIVGGLLYKQCIPYENNEHLLNTTNNCDDYYKTW